MNDAGITIVQRVQRTLCQWNIRLISKEDNMMTNHMAKEFFTWKSNL